MITLYIKNMVCNRCILAVKQVAEKLRLNLASVSMGAMELNQPANAEQEIQLRKELANLGFEVLDDQKKKTIEKIKVIIIEQIHGPQLDRRHNLSDILSEKLHKDYSHISSLFSEVEGTTIEKYAIAQKIEKAKELIIYAELNLSEIALALGYSSVAHLSNQFKKVTGLTPSHFRQVGFNKRKPLDTI